MIREYNRQPVAEEGKVHVKRCIDALTKELQELNSGQTNRDERKAFLLRQIALYYLLLDEPAKANEAALNAVDLAQNDFDAFLTLAETYDELFRKDESEESLRSARNAFERAKRFEQSEKQKSQANSFLAQLLWSEAINLQIKSSNLGWMGYRKRLMPQQTQEEKEEFQKRQTQTQKEMKLLLAACEKFAESYSMSPSSITLINLYMMDITLYKLFGHRDLNCCCGCWSTKTEICNSHIIPKSVLNLILDMYPLQKMICLADAEEPRILQSPGSHSWKMLCKDCEQLLSKSEKSFAREFVSRVLESSNNSTTESISYESWLKFALVSIVWRETIYSMIANYRGFPLTSIQHLRLLHACRYFWGKSRGIPMINEACSRSPNVALIISPPLCSRIPGFNNFTQFSHGFRLFGPNANIFYAHFSIFNVLVMDNGPQWDQLPQRVKIQEGGQFEIPSKESRFDDLPDWFMSGFCAACAKCQEMFDYLERGENSMTGTDTKNSGRPDIEKIRQQFEKESLKISNLLLHSIIQQSTEQEALNDTYRVDTHKAIHFLPSWILSDGERFDLYQGKMQTVKNDYRDDMTVFGARIYLCRNVSDHNNQFALIVVDRNSFLYMCCCLQWDTADQTRDENVSRRKPRIAQCDNTDLYVEMLEFWHDESGESQSETTFEYAARRVSKLIDSANANEHQWFRELTYKQLIYREMEFDVA